MSDRSSKKMSSRGGAVNGKANVQPGANHGNPGFGSRALPPHPPQHPMSAGPEVAQRMDQPPPYYSLSQMNPDTISTQPGPHIYIGHQILQQWPLHYQNAPLAFPPPYSSTPAPPAGGFSPPMQECPSNILPPFIPQTFALAHQFYQPPPLLTASHPEHQSFVPYPSLPQINPILNNCNVQFNTPTRSSPIPAYPNVTAYEMNGAVYYSYNGQFPPVASMTPLQSFTPETDHFNKLNNEVAASRFDNDSQKPDGLDVDRDVASVSNVPSYRRPKPRKQWKRKNY